MNMNLYLISQDINEDYDTYDAAVVAAENEDDARKIHPDGISEEEWKGQDWWDTWVKYTERGKIKVEHIGVTNKKRGIILASFNAG